VTLTAAAAAAGIVGIAWHSAGRDRIAPYVTGRLPSPYAVPVVTVEVAGQFLGLGRTQSYSAAVRGDIPTIRVNGRLHVPVAALYALLGLPVPVPGARPVVDR
jgi:hypothetical protein